MGLDVFYATVSSKDFCLALLEKILKTHSAQHKRAPEPPQLQWWGTVAGTLGTNIFSSITWKNFQNKM